MSANCPIHHQSQQKCAYSSHPSFPSVNVDLEQPWLLAPEEFTRRAPRPDQKQFTAARDETATLTAQIEKVEREIDARVTALYGL